MILHCTQGRTRIEEKVRSRPAGKTNPKWHTTNGLFLMQTQRVYMQERLTSTVLS